MSETHVVTLTLEKDYRYRATFESVPGTPSIALDEPPPLGEATGPNAMDMLAAAIGNCLAASLTFCMKKSRAELSSLEVTVTTNTGRSEANRLRISQVDVQLKPRFAAEDAARMERCRGLFEDFCTVTASIRNGITVNVSVE